MIIHLKTHDTSTYAFQNPSHYLKRGSHNQTFCINKNAIMLTTWHRICYLYPDKWNTHQVIIRISTLFPRSRDIKKKNCVKAQTSRDWENDGRALKTRTDKGGDKRKLCQEKTIAIREIFFFFRFDQYYRDSFKNYPLEPVELFVSLAHDPPWYKYPVTSSLPPW